MSNLIILLSCFFVSKNRYKEEGKKMTDTKLIEKLQASCNEHVDNIGFIINEMKQGNKKNSSSL